MSDPSPRHDNIHLKTYTAGEDGSRLKAMAKELGLQKQRQPRKQVRAVRADTTYTGYITRFVQDSTTEDALMRSVYTSHTRAEDDDLLGQRTLLKRMHASWGAGEFDEALEESLQEEDPHAVGLGSNLTSAVLGIIKGMVGPAILYLPHGFAGAGYATAFPIMLGATAMFLYASRCLLDAWKHESTKDTFGNGSADELTNFLPTRKKKRIILSYPELAYRALGSTGETLVKTGIALMQSGVCLTYLIFVPQNLHTSMKTLAGVDISPELWLIVMIVIQIPLSWIRDIRKLTPTNFVANALILYGLLLCLGFAFSEASHTAGMRPLESVGNRLKGLDPFNGEWFLFIGTSVSWKYNE
jgi:proton-coupled amino acid transporter